MLVNIYIIFMWKTAFLSMTQKEETTKGKMDESDQLKTQNSYTMKNKSDKERKKVEIYVTKSVDW